MVEMTPEQLRDFDFVRSRMVAALAEVHAKRKPDQINLEYELRHMLEAVNVARAARGHPPVKYEDIQRVDAMAAGHTDYAFKFALYCTELAVGRSGR